MSIEYCGSPCECAEARCDYEAPDGTQCRERACEYSDFEEVPEKARKLGWYVPEDHWEDDWRCPKHRAFRSPPREASAP